MRRSCACLTLALFACSGEPELPDRPVDMQFRASVEQLENSCGDADNYQNESGATAVVDVFLRSNGNVNISNWSWLVPGRGTYEDIVLKNGRIDHTLKVATSTEGKTYDHRLTGTVTQEAVDIELAVPARSWTTDGDCVRRVRIAGAARPLLDPNALDGAYKVLIADHGFACPGEKRVEGAAEGGTLVRVDHYASDKAAYQLGQLSFGGSVPDENGILDLEGPLFLGGFIELQGTVKGLFTPAEVDIAVDYGLFGDPTGCTFLFEAKGAKRIPSLEAVDNEYRVAIAMDDQCGFGLEPSESSAEIITQSDGKVVLVDPYLGVATEAQADGSLAYTSGSEEDGAVLTVKATAAPPRLDYSIEYRELQGADWCTVAYTAAGHVRYVFE